MSFNHYHFTRGLKLLFPLIIFLSLNQKSAAQCNNWLYMPTHPGSVTVGDLDVTGNQITVEATINRTQPYTTGTGNGNEGDIVSKHLDPNTINYLLRPNHAYITTTNGFFATPDICEIELNKTYHVALVYDGISLKFYRNGFLMSQVAATGNLFQNDLPTRIGLYSGAIIETFLGYINEVRIWNVARSQADIQTYINTSLPNPTTQPGLQAYYIFNNLLNKQGNAAFNGTILGSAVVNQTNPNCTFVADSCSVITPCNNWLNTPVTGSAVTVGDLDVTGNQLTVEAQFNRTAPLNSGVFYGHLVSKHTGPNANYALLPNGCEITTTVSGYKATFQNCIPQLNKTYHVAMVYDGASLKFYRNGFLLSQTPCTGNMVTNDLVTTIAQISSSGNPPDNQFLGYVNEVRIWNVARTQNELRSFMNTSLPNPTTQTGLLGYYSFNNLLNKQGNAAFNGTALGSAVVNQTNPNCSLIADSCNIIQPVVPSFIIPDTVCVNEPVNIINTTNGASSYYWNFCVSNINQTPIGTNLGTFGGAFPVPVFMDYVQENGNYYGFLTNYAPGKLLRLDFGNSLLNIPTVTDLGNFGGTIPLYAEGIQMVKNEGKWYAIMVAGYPPASTPRVLKVEFGTNITNPAPVATSWGNIGNLLQPVDLHVFQEAGNWYGFTVNAENNTITRFNFTNSFDNTPTAVNLGNVGNLSYPTGIYAIKDGINWRVFITNGGNNTRTSGTFSLSRFDFGSSLLNTPTGVNLGNPGGLLRHPRDLTIMKFCDQIVGFAVNGFLNMPDMVRMDFNNDLTSVPTITSLGNNGNLGFPHSLSKIFRVGADLYTFITNADNGSITRLQFAGCNNASIPNFTGPNPPLVTYNTPGTYNINLTIDDGLATQANICRQIVVVGNPVINISNDTSICRNTAIQLSASGGGSYLWTPAATLNNTSLPNPVASPSANTTYYVTVTNTSGCSNTDSVKINVAAASQFTASIAQSVCINETVQLNASGGDIYMWSPAISLNNALIASPVASTLITTSYMVTITDTTCNESTTLTVPVTVLPLPVVSATKSNDIDCSTGTAQLSATGASQYTWSPAAKLTNASSATPTASPIATTQYYVSGIDQFGCTNTDSVTVDVSFSQKGGYLMASAFTPNNDGLNDCFGIKYWGDILELEFNIFNRWGERVFHTTNPAGCWNGKFKGVEQKTDVYVYWIRAKTVCEPLLFRKGTITLIR